MKAGVNEGIQSPLYGSLFRSAGITASIHPIIDLFWVLEHL
jgi:hypothetical protein